jgi:exodeoxyribonuclease VII small subunit
MTAPADGPVLSFSEALDELEGILRRVESEEVDIDRLAAELQRASVLLEICRGKIRKAEVEVTQIVQRLEESGDPQ